MYATTFPTNAHKKLLYKVLVVTIHIGFLLFTLTTLTLYMSSVRSF